MGKIIEIWRTPIDESIPTRFTVGQPPMPDSPPVKSIAFYETGAMGGAAYRGPCYVVTFLDTDVKRIVPSSTVVDIAYDTESSEKKKEKVEVPPLKEAV